MNISEFLEIKVIEFTPANKPGEYSAKVNNISHQGTGDIAGVLSTIINELYGDEIKDNPYNLAAINKDGQIRPDSNLIEIENALRALDFEIIHFSGSRPSWVLVREK